MLAQARAEYVCRCLSDRDHTPKKQHSELEALYKAARRFREALCHYGDQGWPGWPIVESSAEVERERLVKERKRLEAPLLKWRLRERRLRKQKMTIASQPSTSQLKIRDADNRIERLLEKIFDKVEPLRKKIHQIDEAIILHDQSPTELLYRSHQAAAALDVWLRITFERQKSEKAERRDLFASDRAEKGEGHLTANRWLICKALPEIYAAVFDPEAVGLRISKHPDTSVPSGPKLAFARAVLREFAVRNEKGEPYADETIVNYWKKDHRQMTKGAQPERADG